MRKKEKPIYTYYLITGIPGSQVKFSYVFTYGDSPSDCIKKLEDFAEKWEYTQYIIRSKNQVKRDKYLDGKYIYTEDPYNELSYTDSAMEEAKKDMENW